MPDYGLQGVVRRARQAYEFVAGAQDAEQCRRQRVGAADELRANESRLRFENVRKQRVKLFTTDVAVSVTCRRFEVRVGNF